MPGEPSVPEDPQQQPIDVKETYPLDLVEAIDKARSEGRGSADDTETAELLTKSGLVAAEWLIKQSVGGNKEIKTAKDWAMYHAVKGQVAQTADFLALAQNNPQLAGEISSQQAYALLALSTERSIQGLTSSKFVLPGAYGVKVPSKESDEALDEMSIGGKKANIYKEKAGLVYQEIQDLAKTPKFARFVPKVGYMINPALSQE